MEMAQTPAFSKRNLLLAEQHKVGQPIALYEMQAKQNRNRKIMLGINIGGAVVAGLIVVCIIFYSDFSLNVIPIAICIVTMIKGAIFYYVLTRDYPVSLLIATEGLLVIRPKKVEVMYWDEVTDIIYMRISKYHILQNRKNRKSVTIHDMFENMDTLINQIEQYTQKDIFKL